MMRRGNHYQNSQYSQQRHQHHRNRQNPPQNHYHQHQQQHNHHHHHGGQQQQQQMYPPPNAPAHPPPLPPGWVEATDPSSGKIYFANPQTQETQWDRPMVIPPPPPPAMQHPSPDWNVQVRVPASAAQSYDGIRTSQTTGRSTGEGNQLYTAGGSARSNLAVLQPEKIVMVARSMLEKVQAFPDRTTASDLELHSLNPGQIADLCKLQQRLYQQIQQEKQKEHRRKQQQQKELQQMQQERRNRHGDTESSYGYVPSDAGDDDEDMEYVPLPPYTPINPFTMPLSGGILLDQAEPGRLDVRMNSLREELKAFGYTPADKVEQ